MTIHIINPEAEKVIDDLIKRKLISIVEETTTHPKWHENDEFVNELNEEIKAYKKGELKTHTLEEVKEAIENRTILK